MSNLSGVQPDDFAAGSRAAATPLPRSAAGDIDPLTLGPGTSTTAGHAELFRRAQGGDRGAFGQIVQLYQDRVYNAVLRTVGDIDEARDLTQETFTRALGKIDGFRGEAQPYTWLFRIALNLSISRLRQVRRHRTFSLDATATGASGNSRAGGAGDEQAAALAERVAVEGSAGPAEQVECRERNAAVLAALGRLDPEYRAVLVMRDIEGFDYQQMADVLGMPLGTLKSRLFRARIALRDELKPYMDGKKQ